MRIIYFGHGVRGLKCLDALMDDGQDIVAVVGHPGRKSDVVKCAEERCVAVYQPEKVNDFAFVDELRKWSAELFVLSGYNRILRSQVIGVPSKACINLHGGKLPEYRGCAPINWQIINGEKIGGCCIIFVDEGIDTGDIISQSYYEISDTDTSQDIVRKQLSLFPDMLKKVVRDFESDTVKANPQNKKEGTYYTRRYPEDGLIQWDILSAGQVCNLVRALVDPYPNAFSFYKDRKVRIRKAFRILPPVKGVPGRLPLKQTEGVVVCCRDEGILVTEAGFDDVGPSFNPRDVFKIGSHFVSL